MTKPSEHTNFEPGYHRETAVEEGALTMAAAGLEHGHIYAMCHGMKSAGAAVKWVWDNDPEKVRVFQQSFPEAEAAASLSQILQDGEVNLVASAAIPAERGPLGLKVMDHGKHYFSAKAPFTTLEQLQQAEEKTEATGLNWAVFYSERLQVECAGFAGQLIEQGAIGEVIQVLGTGPHRLNIDSRPEWFFQKEPTGGIVCDIGSHQIEQFLWFSGARDAEVLSSTAANMAHPEHPEFEDYGDAHFRGDNGAVHYFRVDWFTPDGLSNWGDGRTIILGTEGYIELRKYVDLTDSARGERLYLVNQGGERKYDVEGKVGFPYFFRLAKDVVHGTATAMPQEHAFKAAELSLKAQKQAVQIKR
ncbi:Predicted dehydrogenase [Marinococcus luteus]|uniref:Predicted dehydrogenase n=1 Tax=Marinococcus luteus TaxID=1122204 RepID=A0A1H2UHT9_9BACI|nr:Gfo/Idh/MocA family oxidoreductase [Marinococcus luteus]SDW55498.1 Predicted dehydrogenase [Marinococcus luteus]